MTTSEPIKVGVIGFGLAGNLLHGPVIAAVPGLRFAKAVTSRVDEVPRRFTGAVAVATPEALWADPEIELVVIATPNEQHAPLARAALEAGKHVVVDKPFVVEPEQGAALIALARAKQRLLTVFHNRRWDGDFLTVQRLVRGGALGEVALAEMCWDRFRPQIKQGWREEARQGSGLFADLAPHLLDQTFCLFGWPEAVSAELLAQREQALVDDYFSVTLHYGQRRVRLASSTLVATPRPRFALHGTGGSFVKYGLDTQEASLRAAGRPGDEHFGLEPEEAYGTLTDGAGQSQRVPSERGDWRCFYQGVVQAIRGDGPAPVDPWDAVNALRLMALAVQSAKEGRVLPFAPSAPGA